MQTYRTPFSLRYWKDAASELTNTRHLVLAALLVALRVAIRSVSIPIAENLYVSVVFLPNALGSLIYGPVVALIAGAASDLLGSFLFPRGPFFPPFTLVEMLSSFIFALFLYKAPLKVWRVAAAKLSVNLLCNILLTPLFLAWMLGRAAIIADLPRIVKNIMLFPIETTLLILMLNSLLPALSKLHIIPGLQTSPVKPPAVNALCKPLLFTLVFLILFIINPNPAL